MIISRLPSGGGNTKIIARAIGSPAAERDKPEALAGIIDAAQADIAALCNERGCNIPADPTFPDIIDGISGITHFTRPAQISGLAAAGAHDTAGLMDVSWTNPSGDRNFAGVRVMYKAGGYPSSATDGTVGYDGTGTSIRLSGLTNGTAYYVRAFAYNFSNGAYSYNTQTTGAQCTCTPTLNAPPQVSGLAVTTGSTVSGYMRVTWTNPTAATFAGVRIMYKAGSYPTSPIDGTLLYAGTGTAAEKTGLANGTAYYVRAFSYNLSNSVYSYNNQLSGAQATGTPYINKGRVVFTESTTWTVPAGVTSVDVFLVGGGGAGGSAKARFETSDPYYVGDGGGGGFTKTVKTAVTPGQKIAVTVGAGGVTNFNVPTTPDNGNGRGGTTSFGSYSVLGGYPGMYKGFGNDEPLYNSGGSGGGQGGNYGLVKEETRFGGCGGKDGSNGMIGNNAKLDGTQFQKDSGGQGTTTKEFGEAAGTGYAAGGSGASQVYTTAFGRDVNKLYRPSVGDGGGAGGVYLKIGTDQTAKNPTDGVANTGGGGGGWQFSNYVYHAKGGSGLCIVRWGY